jgi:NADP-dependent 3-hydroxy acid dehydrogenase YdfG
MEMLKGKRVAVTGHTSGIGKEIYDYCMFHGADVRGYSRSNGYNITERTGDHIINECLMWDADIVFNHAWVPRAQNKILKILHTQWKDKDKVIINTGSATCYYSIGADIYESDKAELRDYCIMAAKEYPFKNKCRIHNVSMGWTNSAILDGVEDGEYFIPPYEAALVMINLVQPQNYVVSEIVVNAKFKPLKDMVALRDIAQNNVLKSLTDERNDQGAK